MREGPDAGWAWAVAFAACIINFIAAGMGRISGILFVAFMEIFKVDRKSASTPPSIRSSMRNLFGPVVGILGQKYGARKIMIAGAILTSLGSALCFVAPDIMWITLFWGGCSGAGSALVSILPQVVIGQYFKKYHATAAGMGFSGGCVGSVIFPFLLEFLLKKYGVGGTFLILSGIILHTLPAALIFLRPSWVKRHISQNNVSILEMNKNIGKETQQEIGKDLEGYFSNNSPKYCNTFPDIQFLRRNNDLVVKLLIHTTPTEGTVNLAYEGDSSDTTKTIESYVSEAIEDLYCLLQYPNDKTLSYQNFVLTKCFPESLHKEDANMQKSYSFRISSPLQHNAIDIVKTNSVPDISTASNEISRNCIYRKLKTLFQSNPTEALSWFPTESNEIITKTLMELEKVYTTFSKTNLIRSGCNDSRIKNSEAMGVQSESNKTSDSLKPSKQCSRKVKSTERNTIFHHIKTMVKLYKNPMFLLISACRTTHFLTFVPVNTTVVDFAIDKGLMSENGKYAIIALACGDLFGRMCLGWITDRGLMTLPKFMLVFSIIHGCNTALLPITSSFSHVFIFLTLSLFGALQGALFVRHAVLMLQYTKTDEKSIAMGCINLFSGFLGFVLPLYIGYFRDTIGSYDYMFHLNGLINVLVGLLWIFVPQFLRCHTNLEEK